MKRCLPFLLLTAGLLSVAQAQPPRSTPWAWWENAAANGLTLSDAQRDRINAIVSEYRDRITLERQEAERAENDFESVVNADTLDTVKGWRSIDKLVIARQVFIRDLSAMTLKLRGVLTAEQWRTLQERRGPPRRPDTGKASGPQPPGRRGGPGYTPSGPPH